MIVCTENVLIGRKCDPMEERIKQQYDRWLSQPGMPADLADELKSIAGDEDAITDRFYRELEFGTGGLRGVIGAGTNRMNVYNIRKATQGLANYLNASDLPKKVAIGYDSRIKSDVFAKETAAVLAANGIKAYIYPRLEPTPALSWAVRYYGCGAGVCVTASHNPAKYNGYKVYGADGCQITLEVAAKILAAIEAVDCFAVQPADFDAALAEGKIEYSSEKCLDDFVDAVYAQRVGDGAGTADLKLVYTPLNGSGLECVKKLLAKLGVTHVTVVPEQEKPDGNFPTCPYPNPEIKQAFELALKMNENIHADLLLATDPDCDRVGIAVMQGGKVRLMSGNEVGAMLLNYLLEMRKQKGTLSQNSVAVKSFVSTDLAQAIAARYGCTFKNLLTGFKYIGEVVTQLESQGRADDFVMGFEESYGYLAGTHARDKDAVVASMLICEMAAYYKLQGLSLGDVMDKMYADYGYYDNAVVSYTFEGEAGMEKMAGIMNHLRQNPPKSLGGSPVVEHSDYQSSLSTDLVSGKSAPIDLPKSNVLEYKAENGCKLIVRPSGTEPKIKTYVTAVAADKAVAQKMGQQLIDESAAWMA